MAMFARFKWLVVPTVFGSLVGFLVSYLLRPQYCARAVIEAIGPTQYDYPGRFGKSASEKLATYLQQAISLNNLRPLIVREGIAKSQQVESVYEEIRKNTTLKPGVCGTAASPNSPVDLIYTDSACRGLMQCFDFRFLAKEKGRRGGGV